MSRLKKWWKKLIGGSTSGSPSPAPAKMNRIEIESRIDKKVENFLGLTFFVDNTFLLGFNPDVRYWQSVVKAICFAESNFNPRERFFERSMGYYSEGLMQLSYEDCKAYGYHLNKSKEDIFDVEKNIHLGMIILNRLVRRHRKFIFNDGNYWAVLQPKNKRHQVYRDKFNEYYYQGEM